MAFKLKSRGDLAPIKKFKEVGESVEGVYYGKRQGKVGYPPLIRIGDVAIAMKKQLEDYFNEIPVGSLVRVTFLGKVDIKGGKTMNNFEVSVDDEGGTAPPTIGPSYEDLAAKLALTPGGASMRKAIEDMFPDPVARLERVRAALTERGVAF